MSSYDSIVSLADITDAHDRIRGVVHRTPLDVSNTFAEMSGANEVRLKLENMQRTGAYKIRGAYNMMSQLSEQEQANGVIASSAGNHAQGVAFAAQTLGIDARIVMPEITPAAKIDATEGYGAQTIIHGERYEESYELALQLAEEEGYTFVHPFDEPAIIAGQGTIGLEVLEEFPQVDTMLVAIGGGGLISGIATALKSIDDDVRVVGVQTEGCSHVQDSLRAGEIYERDGVDTIAEGIAASRLGENTFEVIQERVDEVVTVTDVEVTKALTLLTERAKTVSEAAGAVPTAALLSGAVDVTDENVVSLVSGGNINVTALGAHTRRGLMHLDRYARVRLVLATWPEALSDVVDIVDAEGAEFDGVTDSPMGSRDAPNRRSVTISIEGRDGTHLSEVVSRLAEHEAIRVTDVDPELR